nr:transposase family protein [Chroococcidiopsis sp. CCMEE 29]
MPNRGASTNQRSTFKASRVCLHPTRQCLADKGYQGLSKLHPNSRNPHQKPPKATLTPQQRENRQLAQQRVVIEQVFAYLKRFRILSERYRNRRRRFGLRFNLIA